jgi:hypothetical protein
MQKFLVGYDETPFGDRDFVIVNAGNREEAVMRFIRETALNEDIFIEHIYEKTVNMSLAEMFWFQTEKEMEHFTQKGEVLIDVEEFKRRVRKFFGDYTDFAERYLDYYFSESDEPPDELFPEEMLFYIWSESDWADEVIAMPLSDIDEI